VTPSTELGHPSGYAPRLPTRRVPFSRHSLTMAQRSRKGQGCGQSTTARIIADHRQESGEAEAAGSGRNQVDQHRQARLAAWIGCRTRGGPVERIEHHRGQAVGRSPSCKDNG
jgi:hypothetical protein